MLWERRKERKREKSDSPIPGEEGEREQRQQGIGQEMGRVDAHFGFGLWSMRALEIQNWSRRPGLKPVREDGLGTSELLDSIHG